MIEVFVTLSREPTESIKKKIKVFLDDKVKEPYKTTYLLEKDLLGGITIKIGDVLYDGSIKRRISKLKQNF